MENVIKNQTFDEERALYNLKDTLVESCKFEGPADGESALKEARNIHIKNCSFSLRYPFWHVESFKIENTQLDELTRAPIWYSHGGEIINCDIVGVKCLRESGDIKITDSRVKSEEFGWRCDNLEITDSEMESQYFLFEVKDTKIDNLKMKGKYSFQYTENLLIENSYLDTKDAFWHSENVTVKNCTVKGEYLAWYSENLTLIDCTIIGTQPLCYCKGLKLINCKMQETDLSFEYSEVEADIVGNIMSVKNPKSGYIKADTIGEIILENSVMETLCEIKTAVHK